MPTFSIRSLFVGMFLACIASLTLVNASVGMVKVMMLAAAMSILILAVVGVLTRRPIAFVIVTLSVGYLVIADGGTFPSAERYLPSEWALENCCDSHTVLGNACKRSRSSLTQWGFVINPSHADWNYANEGHLNVFYKKKTPTEYESTDATLDDLLDLVDSSSSNGTTGIAPTIKLPVLALTSPVQVITVHKRDDPQNIPFFIVGHCLVVIAMTAVAIIHYCSVRKRGRALTNKPNKLHTLHVPKLKTEN